MTTKEPNARNGLWIGTKRYMRFVPAPSRGADATSVGYHDDATGKNGGGYVSQSFGRHRTFQYDWPRSTDRQYANFLQNLRDGAYGRGVIHFTDPTCYLTNVLPAHWASPGLTLGFEAPPLVFRNQPDTFDFGQSDRPNTPLVGATYYSLPSVMEPNDALFVAIPPDRDFLIGSRYENTEAGSIFVQPVDRNFGLNEANRVTLVPGIDPINPFQTLTTDRFSGNDWGGVYIWIGRPSGSPASSTVSILDMVGKIVPPSFSNDAMDFPDEPWYGGEGHTGVRFEGQPTIQYDGKNNTAVSATFTEVGAWELASRL